MKMIFFNKNSQLRSGYKILITLAGFIVLLIIYTSIAEVLYSAVRMFLSGVKITNIQDYMFQIGSDSLFNFILNLIQTFCMIVSVYVFWRVFDKRPLRDLGFTNPFTHIKDFVTGLAAGAISISTVFIVLKLSGQIEVINSFFSPDLSLTLISDFILFIMVGINEELFSRGYCMTVLKQTKSPAAMVIISSCIFSVLHSLNPNISIIGFINIFLVGVLLSLMFLLRGNLWLPIGYHITWNYFQGNVFGFQVSGLDVHGMYQIRLNSHNIINGGLFGPEGGIVTTFVIALSIVIILSLKGKNHKKISKYNERD